jgi:hypothetical protein
MFYSKLDLYIISNSRKENKKKKKTNFGTAVAVRATIGTSEKFCRRKFNFLNNIYYLNQIKTRPIISTKIMTPN